MYSTYNEGKTVVAERFIRALKNKIYKCVISISIFCIHELVDMVNKYNSTYHSTVNMNRLNVKSSTYIDFRVENNEKDPKCESCNDVKTSEYKKITTGRLQIDPKTFL